MLGAGNAAMAGPGRWLSTEEQRAWRAYIRAHARLFSQLNARLVDRSGLTIADYEVLVNLSEAPRRRLRVFELAAAMEWEKSRLSHHVTRMQRRGLVDRTEASADARGAYVLLTRAGRQALERAAPSYAEDVRRWFLDPLDDGEVARLAGISARLLAGLEDEA